MFYVFLLFDIAEREISVGYSIYCRLQPYILIREIYAVTILFFENRYIYSMQISIINILISLVLLIWKIM